MMNASNFDLFGDSPATTTGPLMKGRCPMRGCTGRLVGVMGGWVCQNCDYRKVDHARARRTDPETSKAAARSLDPETLRDSQREVLAYFDEHKRLADIDLIRHASQSGCKQSESGLRTRRKELVDKKFLKRSGEFLVVNRRRHIVWERV